MKDIAAVAVFMWAVTLFLGVAGAYPEIGRPLIVERFSIGTHAGSGHTQYDGRQFNDHVFNASKVSTSFPVWPPRNSINYGPHLSNTDLSRQSYSIRLSRQNMPNAYLPPMKPGYLPPSPIDQTGIPNGGLTPLYQSGYPGPSNLKSPQGRFLNYFNTYPDTLGESTPYNFDQNPSVNEIGQSFQGGGSANRFNPTNGRNAQTYPGLQMVPISSLRPATVPSSPSFPDQVLSPPGQAYSPPGIGRSYTPPGIGKFASPPGQAYSPPGIGQSYTPPGIGQFASAPGQAYGPPSIGQSYTPPGIGKFASPPGQAYSPPSIGQSYTPPGIGQFASAPRQANGPPGIGQPFIPPSTGQPSLGVDPDMFSGGFPPSLALLNADPLVPAAQSIVQFISNPNNSDYFFSYIVADPVHGTYYRFQELRENGVVSGFYIIIHPDTHVETTIFEGGETRSTNRRYNRAVNFLPDDA